MEDFVFETQSNNYLESLMCSRQWLTKKSELLEKLDTLIGIELDVAIMGAAKARNELVKETAVIRPIK